MHKLKLLAAVLILIFTTSLGILIYHVNYTYSKMATIYIPPHTTSKQIAQLLHQDNLISNRTCFRILAKIMALQGDYLKFGEYAIPEQSTMLDIARLINSGKVIQHKITIPEGLSNYQIVEILNKAYGLNGQVDHLQYEEGWLMPDTYQYTYPTEKSELLNQMNQAMRSFLSSIMQEKPEDYILKTEAEVITLASIVEKETGLEQERSMVAAVYLNRLRKNMPLQADPTVVYGITEGKYDMKRLLYADLQHNSPYNTYIYAGLPPKAIANPGRNSIRAVLSPAPIESLYFVATGDGGHKFANSYAEHLRNVSAYRKNQLR